jgi:hypothetical protein
LVAEGETRTLPDGKWPYNSTWIIESIGQGTVPFNEDAAFQHYLDWMQADTKLNFLNEETGEKFTVQAPKRGNQAYGRRKYRSMKKVVDGMNKLDFDFTAIGRPGLNRHTHLLLVTLTFDPSKVSKERAWYLCSTKGGALNLFRANLTNKLGSKASITVKEAQENGFPAPHLLIMLDRPVRMVRHVSRKNGAITFRMKDPEVLHEVKKKWTHGFVDVEGVVRRGRKYKGYSSPVLYLAKYLIKGMNVEKYPELKTAKSLRDVNGKLRIALNTHFWNKMFRMRDIYISKAFKERLNTLQEAKKPPSAWVLSDITYRSSKEPSRALAEGPPTACAVS